MSVSKHLHIFNSYGRHAMLMENFSKDIDQTKSKEVKRLVMILKVAFYQTLQFNLSVTF